VSAFCHWLAAVHWGQAGTWALAIGTFSLACFTYKMAKSTEKTLEQNKLLVDSNNMLIEKEERHHQENLMPLCVLEPTEPKIGDVGRQLFADVKGYNKTKDVAIFYLAGKIINKGTGPALNVKIKFYTNCNSEPIETQVGTIAVAGSYCIYDNKRHLVPMKVFMDDRTYGHDNAVRTIESEWVLCILFEDVFGNKFYSVHKNDIENVFVGFAKGVETCCQKNLSSS
jgi:hypothetical protein